MRQKSLSIIIGGGNYHNPNDYDGINVPDIQTIEEIETNLSVSEDEKLAEKIMNDEKYYIVYDEKNILEIN
jgi:hypothetical protein